MRVAAIFTTDVADLGKGWHEGGRGDSLRHFSSQRHLRSYRVKEDQTVVGQRAVGGDGRQCAQDTEQKHRKHGSGALLSSFPLLLVAVLAEHGGCLSSVDRDRGLRIWREREARRNECETRCWLTLERVRNSLPESFRSRRLSLVAGRDAKSQSVP